MGEFGHTLQGAIVLMMLPIYGETNATSVSLSDEDSKKLKKLNNALTASNHRGRHPMLYGAGTLMNEQEHGVVWSWNLLSYWLF